MQSMTRGTKIGVTKMTTGTVPVRTRPAASLHHRSTIKGMAGITETCMMSSTVEMHMAGLKIGAKIGSMPSRSSARRGTMIIVAHTMTNITGSILQKRDTF
jgi:hypothetical protein